MDKSYTPLSESELIKSESQETPRKKTTLQDMADAFDSYDPIKTDFWALFCIIYYLALPAGFVVILSSILQGHTERWWELLLIVLLFTAMFIFNRFVNKNHNNADKNSND